MCGRAHKGKVYSLPAGWISMTRLTAQTKRLIQKVLSGCMCCAILQIPFKMCSGCHIATSLQCVRYPSLTFFFLTFFAEDVSQWFESVHIIYNTCSKSTIIILICFPFQLDDIVMLHRPTLLSSMYSTSMNADSTVTLHQDLH